MISKTESAQTSLQRASRWLGRLKTVAEDDEHQAVNVVIGCFHIIGQSPTTNLHAWLDRRPERQGLRRPAQAVRTPRGRRAMHDLIRLALSELSACAAWRDSLEVGPLPVAEPKTVSAAHLQAIRSGYARWQAEQRQHQEQVRQRAQTLLTRHNGQCIDLPCGRKANNDATICHVQA